jgi:hypothetical protein
MTTLSTGLEIKEGSELGSDPGKELNDVFQQSPGSPLEIDPGVGMG